MTIITSCSKKSTETTVDQTPTISFATVNGFLSHDVNYPVDSLFKVRIIAASNTSSKAPLTKLTITTTFSSHTYTQDTTFSTSALNLDITAKTFTTPGAEKWAFKVTDQKGQSKEISLTITGIVTMLHAVKSDPIVKTVDSQYISFTGKKD
ncbi:MAG: hypothetical protein WCO44_13455 [Bacteroidota bacterium]